MMYWASCVTIAALPCRDHRDPIMRLPKFVLLSLFCTTSSTMATQNMRAVLFKPGGPENMWVGEVPKPDLRPNELLVRVCYTALNRADTLQRKGSYPPPPGESEILGVEVSGVVDDLHSSCKLNWRKGDRVMALVPGGGYAEYVAVQESHVMPAPDSFSLSNAAAIPEVWLTSYQLLHFVGKVKSGDNVLIHAGGSGVGTSLVQLSRLAGAVPYVTAGSELKIKNAVDLGAEAGFNYKTGDFSDWILEKTQGKGADVITDCVGGSYWEKNAKCLARDGHWVVYGLLGGANVNGSLLGTLLRKRATISGTTLRTRSIEYKTELVAALSKNVLPHFGSGKLKPIVDSIFPMDKISEAHQKMESNTNIGKIVVEIQPEDGKKSEL